MSGADKQGQESWEWPVYKALWSYPRQWFSPQLSVRGTRDLCKNTGVHAPPPESLNQLVLGGAQAQTSFKSSAADSNMQPGLRVKERREQREEGLTPSQRAFKSDRE